MLWLINLAALFEKLINFQFLELKSILDFEVCHPYSYCKINKVM